MVLCEESLAHFPETQWVKKLTAVLDSALQPQPENYPEPTQNPSEEGNASYLDDDT